MIFQSVANIGSKIWVTGDDEPRHLTVGQITIIHVDSKGSGDDDEMFDNYKPQKSYTESYMCDETGIGSGTVYTLNKHAFTSYPECVKQIAKIKSPRRVKDKGMDFPHPILLAN